YQKFGIFPPTLDLAKLLTACFQDIDASLADTQLANFIENKIAEHFVTHVNASSYLAPHDCPELVYRITTYSRLAGGTDPLLKVPELTLRSVNFRDMSADVQRTLASYVSEERVLDSSRVMRGFRFPFAWVTDHDL